MMELDHVGGTFGGNVRPTPFVCLILKLLQIQPEKEIIVDIHFPINLQNDGTCQTNYAVFEAMTFPFNEGDRENAKKYYYTFKVH